MYESIIISSPDEWNLARTDIAKLLRTANREYFKYMKSITFIAPITTNDQFRCVHYRIIRDADEDINERSEELVSRLYDLEGLMPQIRPLFQGLQDNQLRSFQYVESHNHSYH
jgi:hypothetical protein